jgi:anti-sigma B factor antagonist
MSTEMKTQDDVLIAMPGERFDTTTAPAVEADLTGQVDEGATKIVIDFSKTTYISSTGLRVLLKVAKVLNRKDGKIALCNANEQIHEVLEISGFMTMLPYCPTLEEAVAKVSG